MQEGSGVRNSMRLALGLFEYRGIRVQAGPGWARGYFFGTLVYLPLLLGILAVDVL